MTEQEWLTSNDPAAMLAWWATEPKKFGNNYRLSDRLFRLFACACCRAVWDGMPCKRCQGGGKKLLPIYASDIADTDVRVLTYSQIMNIPCSACHGTGRIGGLTDPRSRRAVEVAERYADGQATESDVQAAYYGARLAFADDDSFENELAWRCCGTTNQLIENAGLPRWFSVSTKLAPQQANLLRCIVGNPFIKIIWED